jgi:peptidyl-prolyl cis-trans isomerase A (cyclophilin A)
MKPMTSLFLSLVAFFFSCNTTSTPQPQTQPESQAQVKAQAQTQAGVNTGNVQLGDGMYAEIETTKGKIVLQLEYKKTPLTVANFVTLAEGKNEMVTNTLKGKPYYDGLKFHRVINNFMIQTGDPAGNGSGGPGYKFADEITDLKHDKAGILSMANAGKGTNGSQFFITHGPTPHLDGMHTVFGHVIQGQDVVNAIVQGDEMKTVKIIRKGKDANKFDAVKVFKEYYEKAAAEQKKQADAMAKTKKDKLAYFADIKSKATKTGTGLQYQIVKKGSGKKPADGSEVYIHYSGFLTDGTLFDSSVADVAKAFGNYIPAKDQQGGYVPIPFKIGTKQGMIPGFIEGIEKLNIGDKAVIFIPSHLGYGERGAGRVIPPNSDIIFEIEMVATPAKK